MYLLAVLSPFIGSLLSGFGGRYFGARGSGLLTVLGLFLSFALSILMWYEVGVQGIPVYLTLNSWFQASTVDVQWTFFFDSLTVCMMLTVTLVSFCVHVYSLGYMQMDPHLPRFMSYLSLFTGFMLVLVSAHNMIQMLVGWEGIGVCSYLLIGFWFTRLSATKSALKAMLVNRVSDTFLLISIVLMWWYLGSTDYSILFANTNQSYYVDWICFTLLLGAMGKSAQIGLHIWLADAMEGPTPVSALIHAATLVTAGVYLIARTSPLWECSSNCRMILTIVGALTSFMAATCGFFQNDLKRVIAYSTCSQLGYMMVSCGLSHYSLAIYHLMTHACFKALLFLSAGVIIHAMSDVQDMRRHGGSQKILPLAWSAMLLGSLSLAGWPFLSGFYSKDAILETSWSSYTPVANYAYIILMIVACFTSYYSFRLLFCAFISPSNQRKSELPSAGVSFVLTFPLVVLSIGSIFVGYFFSDMLLGWGTNFWLHSIQMSPTTGEWISSHFLPQSALWLPFWSAFVGLGLALCYSWPQPIFSTEILKTFYIFLQTRWQFDFVSNQQIASRVLNWGSDTWMIIDKGVLEVLGPMGLTHRLWNITVPAVRQWQTGIVHDYALIYKVIVIIGLVLLVFPIHFESTEASFTYLNNLSMRSVTLISFLLWEYQMKRS